MKFTDGTITHIAQLASDREIKELSEENRIELFDSIDCLDMEELSELYAIVQVGKSNNPSDFQKQIIEGKEKGFQIAEEIFSLNNLGHLLKVGTKLLRRTCI